jgi:hypothetical protein
MAALWICASPLPLGVGSGRGTGARRTNLPKPQREELPELFGLRRSVFDC